MSSKFVHTLLIAGAATISTPAFPSVAAAQTYRETTYSYGPQNGLLGAITRITPSGPQTVAAYEWAQDDLVEVVDADGRRLEATYDDAHRMVSFTVAPGAAQQGYLEYNYDSLGRMTSAQTSIDGSTSPATWSVNEFEYTATNRVESLSDPSGDTTSFVYDAAGRLSSETDPEGRTQRYDYHEDGLLKYVWEAYGTADRVIVERNWYDALGNRTTFRPARGDARNAGVDASSSTFDSMWRYDAYGRPDRFILPVPATGVARPDEYYGYDDNGNLVSQTTRAGDVITRVYDASNRLIQLTAPRTVGSATLDTTVTVYNLAGEPVSVTAPDPHVSGSWQIAYAYDFAGRLTSETQVTPGAASRTVSYRYDGAGNRTHIIWPDGYTARYVYDAANRLAEVWVADDPDQTGWRLAEYTYDAQGRLEEYRTRRDSAGTLFSRIAFTYEADSDLATMAHDFHPSIPEDVTFTYSYDRSAYLTGQSVDNADWRWSPTTSTVDYDSERYEVNGLDQYTDVSGEALTYDDNGNLVSGAGRSFVYSAQNQLLSATVSGVTTLYAYDPAARRVRKTVGSTVTDFLHAGEMEIAEYDGSGTLLRRYIPGPGVDQRIAMIDCGSSAHCRAGESGALTDHYHPDRQGNVLAVVRTGADTLVQRFTYTPFGVEMEGDATGNPFRYTGRRYDPETGLYYYRARYYDADLGRFLQVDPVGYADQRNLYAYVGNNPLNAADPSGMVMDCEFMGTCNPGSRVGESVNYCNANDCSENQKAAVAAERDAFEDLYGARATVSMASNPELDGDRVRGRQGVTDEQFNELVVEAYVTAGVVIGSAIVDGIPGRTRATAHGRERLAGANATRGGVLSISEVRSIQANGRVMTQADGATVHIQTIEGKHYVVVSGERGVITTFRGLSDGSLARLSNNYGWTE